jgi:hypothetical protein
MSYSAQQSTLWTEKRNGHMDQEKVVVLLPDLFVSIMSPEPRINPHYAVVRQEADEWAKQ